jgi:hypothetical protein
VWSCEVFFCFGGEGGEDLYNCANGHELQKIIFILKEFIEVNDLCVILFAEMKFKDGN